MERAPEEQYFTTHLFRAGLECPTKLYYYSQDYPESNKPLPFIRHAVFNKRLVKALARSGFPEGEFIPRQTVKEAAAETLKKLKHPQRVLFDAVVEYNQMKARLPLVKRRGNQLEICQIEAKAFDPGRHTFFGRHQPLSNKWKSYLFTLAYRGWILKHNIDGLKLRFTLVLPNKQGVAHTDHLPSRLNPYENRTNATNILQENQELLIRQDVTNLIRSIWNDPAIAAEYLPKPTFENSLNYLRALYLKERKEKPQVGLKCKHCEFRIELNREQKGMKSGFSECWRPLIDDTEYPDRYHVFNLIGAGTTRRMERQIYDQREISLDSLPTPGEIQVHEGRLTQQMRQALQIHQAQGKFVPKEIVRADLFDELKSWKYPLHFLDFEAGNYAIPVRTNRKPYHLVVFQFSCHTLHDDGSLTHHEWIDDFKSDYVNYEVIRQLMNVPDIDQGTIVQYSNFERNALKNIRKELDGEFDLIHDAEELISWLDSIIHRRDSSHHQPPYLADLSRQVKHFYYNHFMEDSLSIKDVLQSVMSLSEFLKEKYSKPYSSQNFENIKWWQRHKYKGARNPYVILAEHEEVPVRRGTEAMVVYAKMISRGLTADESEAYRRSLLKYCELDTLAMVMIFEHWKELFSEQY